VALRRNELSEAMGVQKPVFAQAGASKRSGLRLGTNVALFSTHRPFFFFFFLFVREETDKKKKIEVALCAVAHGLCRTRSVLE
jgi:hypothetical protein